ncbi:LuxR C-terminal-related transcriptional regulator [Viscerimonas tarda]
MIFIKSTTVLSDLIAEYHFLVPVINRFGIKLGLEDKTVAHICTRYSLNEDFFLAILNTYLNEDFFPEKKLQKFDIILVTDYLRKTDMHYINAYLPNLEKHLNAFIAMSDSGSKQLKLLNKLFAEFKSEFQNRMSGIEKYMEEDDLSYILLLDMKNILIKHISGTFNENLCYAVLFSVDSLQADLAKHNRIRDKILKPMIKELVESGVDDWQSLLRAGKHEPADAHQPISQRELDVLKLVALGHLNKEIADKLNISLNTVLSHRKNITSKLGIKTVSGLAFYCLSHGYISPEAIDIG